MRICLCAAGAALALACGPIGPIPGGALRGDPVAETVQDWSFLDAEHTVQLETRPDDPYSVNVWIGQQQGRPYVPTSLIAGVDEPSERQWVKNALADPRVRLLVQGRLYDLKAVRVDDAAERESVRAALLAKYEVEASEDGHEDQAWIFRLEPR